MDQFVKAEQLICLVCILLLFSCTNQSNDSRRTVPVPENQLLTEELPVQEKLVENDVETQPVRRESWTDSGSLALDYRVMALRLASFSWKLNHSGLAESDLAKVSAAGFLPIWIRDPGTGEPVVISRNVPPSGSGISYLPIPGVGWDYELISTCQLSNSSATPFIQEDAYFVDEWYGDTIYYIDSHEDVRETSSDDEWDVMM